MARKVAVTFATLTVAASLLIAAFAVDAGSASKSRTKFSASYRIIVANGSGTSRRVVLKRPYPITNLRWRPGTKQLSFGLTGKKRPSPLYLMNADGGKRKVLHRSLGTAPIYRWSPNGNKIAFVGEGLSSLSVLNAKSRKLRHIVKNASLMTEATDFFWSPDSKRLVYYAFEFKPTQDRVLQINADGSGKRQIYGGSFDLFDLSPDGRHVAVPRSTKRGFVLDIADVDGGGVRQIATTEHRISTAQWSPDGTRLSFTTTVFGRAEKLYVVGSDGSGLRHIVSVKRFEDVYDGPAVWWSPDGQRIAYISGTASNPGSGYATLHVVNVDDGSVKRLSGRRSIVQEFEWSPDGERIAFLRRKGASSGSFADVLVVNADGSKKRRLTPRHSLSSDLAWLAWSSDGEQLAFVNITFKRERSPKRK